MTRDDITHIAREAGFERTRSCCGIDDKFCNSDEWRGNMEVLIKLAFEAGEEAREKVHEAKLQRDELSATLKNLRDRIMHDMPITVMQIDDAITKLLDDAK